MIKWGFGVGGKTEGERGAGRASGDVDDPGTWKTWLGQYDSTMCLLGFAGVAATLLFGLATGVGSGKPFWIAAAACALAMFTALAIMLGSFAVGSFVGFLFGLPRTLTSAELRANRESMRDLAGGEDPAKTGGGNANAATDTSGNRAAAGASISTRESSAYSDVNTNLEQISDWLTKIIVGFGLTQIEYVPGRLHQFGLQAGSYFPNGGYAFAIGGGLSALIYGFFFTYVGTRVRLSLVFMKSQSMNRAIATGDSGKARENEEALSGASSDVTAPRNADTVAKNQKAADVPVVQLRNDEQLAGWADAQFQLGNHSLAIDMYKDILKRSPADIGTLTKLAAAHAAVGQQQQADSIVTTIAAIGSTEQATAAQRAVTISQLRKKMQDGIDRQNGWTPASTIEAASELLRLDPLQNDDVQFHTLLAYAYGKQFLQTQDPNDRAQAVAAVEKTLSLDPKQKANFAAQYDSGDSSGGPKHLSSLAPDPTLEVKLLDKPISPPPGS